MSTIQLGNVSLFARYHQSTITLTQLTFHLLMETIRLQKIMAGHHQHQQIQVNCIPPNLFSADKIPYPLIKTADIEVWSVPQTEEQDNPRP